MRSFQRVLKYSGLALQIFAMLGLAAWMGSWLDSKWSMSQPIMTILLTIAMLMAIFFWLYYDLKNLGK